MLTSCGAAWILPDRAQSGAQRGGISDELDPYVDRAEAERFDRVGELLKAQHPAPSQDFLTRIAAGPSAEAPESLWIPVALTLAVGLLLLGLALLGASGSGPLGG